MSKQLDYHSREYDELLDQARRIGWNDDKMNSTDWEKTKNQFMDMLNLNYNQSNETERIKRAARGECY